MGFLQRKAASREWKQPKRKCVAVNKAERSWRSEEHFDIRHGDAEFRVSFGPVFSHCVPIPLFWNDNIHSVPLHIGSVPSAFLF